MTTLRRHIARLLWTTAFIVSPDQPIEITLYTVRRIDS